MEFGPHALVKIAASTTTNLVVTDLVMLEMNGLELTTKIRDQLLSLPVILLTGHANDESRQQA